VVNHVRMGRGKRTRDVFRDLYKASYRFSGVCTSGIVSLLKVTKLTNRDLRRTSNL